MRVHACMREKKAGPFVYCPHNIPVSLFLSLKPSPFSGMIQRMQTQSNGSNRSPYGAPALASSAPMPIYTVGGVAFGASGFVLEERVDVSDEPAEDSKAASKEQLMQELEDLKAMHDREVLDADEFKELKTVLLQKLKGCY